MRIRLWQNNGKKKTENPDCNFPNVEHVLTELDSLVGLQEIKKLVAEISAFVEIQKRRLKEKLPTEPQVLHMIFKGNPVGETGRNSLWELKI
jgi:stage V sporulation protein K